MIYKLPLILILASAVSFANTKTDPNTSKTTNKSTVVAPGCTEFIHPCSGQASTAFLNAATLPVTTKVAIPIKLPPATKAKKTK